MCTWCDSEVPATRTKVNQSEVCRTIKCWHFILQTVQLSEIFIPNSAAAVWLISSRNLKLDKKRVKQNRHPAPGRLSPPVGTNDENKSSCRAENLPVSPSIIQGKAFFSSAASRGAKAREGTTALTHSRVTARGKDTFVLGVSASPSWSSAHVNGGRAVPHFLSSRHWNLKLRHCGIDELSGVTLQSCQGLTPWNEQVRAKWQTA